MGHHGIKIFDNQKKIDFKQTIIDFQEKTILTSLIKIHSIVLYHMYLHNASTLHVSSL